MNKKNIYKINKKNIKFNKKKLIILPENIEK